MNLQTRLSAHFTLGELTRSRSHPEVKNIPSPVQVENLKRVCVWLEALRARYNARYGDGEEPVIITSGYRSAELNRKVGGVATSNHFLQKSLAKPFFLFTFATDISKRDKYAI